MSELCIDVDNGFAPIHVIRKDISPRTAWVENSELEDGMPGRACDQVGRALEAAPAVAVSLSSMRLTIDIVTTVTLLTDGVALLCHFVQNIPLARAGSFCGNIWHPSQLGVG